MDRRPTSIELWALLLWIGCTLFTTRAASPTVVLSLDPPHLTTAQRTTLTLQASAPSGSSIELPQVFTELGGFTVRSQHTSRPQLTEDGASLTTSLQLLLEPVLPGHYQIPPLSTRFALSDGTTIEHQTKPLTSTVTSLLPPITEGLKAKPAAPPARDFRPLLIGLILTLLATTLLLSYRRWKSNQSLPISQGTPTEEILAQLTDGDPQELTQQYLKSRFAIDPLPRAGHEIVAQLTLGEEAKATLQDLLSTLDNQRFANSPEPARDPRHLLESFISATRD